MPLVCLPFHSRPMIAAARSGNSEIESLLEENMKTTSLILRISLTRGVLLASALVLGGLRANSEGTGNVTANGRTIDAVINFEGTATHYTRRGKDQFSIGYY